jgi:hypothetical protein
MRNFLLAAFALLSAGAKVAPLQPGVYAFFSEQTGQVLDVWGSDKKDGAIVSTAQWEQGLNQQFAIQTDDNEDFGIVAFHTLKALTVTDAKKDVNIIQKSYVDANNQHWRIVPKGKGLFAIQSKASGKFLTAGAKRGDKVTQTNGNGKKNQLFKPFRIDHTPYANIRDGAIFTFINRATSLPIEILNADKNNNAKLITYDNLGNTNQQFQIVASRSSPEFVRIKAVHSGKFLACNRGGNQIVQEDKKHGDRGQLWRFVQSEDGSFQIENQAAREAVTAGKRTEGVKHAKVNPDSKNQQFWAVEIL